VGISEVLTVVVDVGRPDDGNHTLQLVLDCGDDVVELGFAEEAQVVNNQEANNWKPPLRVTFDGFGVDMSAGDGLQIGTEFVPWGGAACIMEPDYSFGSSVPVCGESGCTLIPADNATRQVGAHPAAHNSRACAPSNALKKPCLYASAPVCYCPVHNNNNNNNNATCVWPMSPCAPTSIRCTR
jgi:hypothetical protein